MLKDIPVLKVTDLGIAIVPREEQKVDGEVELWDVYLINLKKDTIFNIIINMQGYGIQQEEKIETTNFRIFIENLESGSYAKIESISTNVFHLANQYWVSFTQDKILYDRKYVFVEGSIHEMNFTRVPLLEKRGVMIK